MIRETLLPIVQRNAKMVQQAIDRAGTEQAHDLPEEVVEEARRKLEQALGLPARQLVPRRIRDDLLAAITKLAGDPDDVLADWVRGETPWGS